MSRPIGRRVNTGFARPDVRSVPVLIYGLRERGTSVIRYVGRSQSPKYRLTHHRGPSSENYEVFRWIRVLEREDREIEVITLLRVEPGDDSAGAERDMIRTLGLLGHPLLNKFGRGFTRWRTDEERVALHKECVELGWGSRARKGRAA